MKRSQRLLAAAALSVAFLAPYSAFSQTSKEPGTTAMGQSAATTDGEVRKIDKDAGKLTIKHGEIKSLEMPPMTMVFTVKNTALLERVKAGDKVKFNVIREDGKMVLTDIQLVP